LEFPYHSLAKHELVSNAILSKWDIRSQKDRVEAVQRLFSKEHGAEAVPRRIRANTADVKATLGQDKAVYLFQKRL
jgi:hypothetical protein